MSESKTYSTAEVAQKIGVTKMTVLRWLWSKQIPEPRRVSVSGQTIRVWTERDLARAKKFKGRNYRRKNRETREP